MTIDDTISVTVTVDDVDEPPVISGVTTIDDYDENGCRRRGHLHRHGP